MLARSAPSLPLALALLTALLSAPFASAQPPVYADPRAAAADPDFAVQGEYAGAGHGMQVIARGEGDFEIVVFDAGLPGAGWDRNPPRRLDGDAETVAELAESLELERVERASPTLEATPPPGAIVLFDGSPESMRHWDEGARRTDEGWLEQGATSVDDFTDYTLHLEFRTPFQPTVTGQGRGNSGVYHQGRYETQILDSFGLPPRDNECGGIYEVRDPDLNMCLPPLAWQTYDVDFTAARFDDQGKKTADAKMTVRLNGVVIHRDAAVPGATRAAPRQEGPEPGPIYLQDHGNPVRFRNIWLVPRDADREARRPRVPGFERFHGSAVGDPAASGRVLLSTLSCAACHDTEGLGLSVAKNPILTEAASRIRPDHLVQWIADPHGTKPGTTMPDVLTGLDDAERLSAAEAIASFLTSLAEPPDDSLGDAAAAERGEQLYHTIGCLACHSPQDDRPGPEATSVPLGDLGAKYTLASLAAFLSDPHHVRPAGRMPKLVADAAEARDVACYLLRDVVVVPGAEIFQRRLYRGRWEKLPDFDALEPVASDRTDDLRIDDVRPTGEFGAVYEAYLPIARAGRYTFHLGSDDGSRVVVGDREVINHDGVHPYGVRSARVRLEAGVHPVRIEYFNLHGELDLSLEIEGGPWGRTPAAALMTADPEGTHRELVPATFQADPERIAEGRALFQSIGCADCHAVEVGGERLEPQRREEARPRPALAQLRSGAGCLAESPAAGVPDFALSAAQRAAITEAVRAVPEIVGNQAAAGNEAAHREGPAEESVHLTMLALNCYACHARDGRGGPELSRDGWFETTRPEMGTEGRLPPDLTGVGDKLRDEYLSTMLTAGVNERPAMRTRMPGFGRENTSLWQQAVTELDRRSERVLPGHDDPDHRVIAEGRLLVGNDGLACVKCHSFAGRGLPGGIEAIDMLRMTDRLREDWFHRYLLDPQAYRPGTRMPGSFPDGRSVLTSVLDGDPARQIDAMWQYLLEGENAKIPAGLDPEAIELRPTDRPILYRNFLTGLSPRGMAVGYPEGVHLAWDAEAMALRKVWQNQFLDAAKHWRGRGPGQQGPLGDAVLEIEEAAPVAVLESFESPWPTESARQRGYRFLGYRLDPQGRPTWRYQVGGVTIEDFPQPVGADESGSAPGSFRRQVRIEIGERTPGLTFRAARGQIEPLGEGFYRIDDLLVMGLEGADATLIEVAGQQELRIRLEERDSFEIIQSLHW